MNRINCNIMLFAIGLTFLPLQTNAKKITTTAKSVVTKSQSAPKDPKKPKLETATFAAGCFWGTEAFFQKIPGVMKTRVGYTGGTLEHPTYEMTQNSRSGHAESVEVEFDPKVVSYDHLLDQFFKMHDPTTLNKQGNDAGTEYRSAIFYHSPEQKAEAEAFMKKVEKSKAWKAPVVTEVSEAKKFWPAEEEHQNYLKNHPGGYDNHYLRKISFDGPPS